MAVKKIKDTDYLYLSAYVHAKETKIIGKDRIERMLEARSPEEALKVLEDVGWSIPESCDASKLEKLLSDKRSEVFKDVGSLAPNVEIVNVFRIKYDYHNAKALIKASAVGANAKSILSGAGRIPSDALAGMILEGSLGNLPEIFRQGIEQARDVLARTGDPQLADFILDKAYYAEFLQAAKAAGSSFLEKYTALCIDSANLRSLVRAFRMEKDYEYIRQALIEGGSVKMVYLTAALTAADNAIDMFLNTPLAPAIEAAKAAAAGGKLTEFEKLCDNVLNAYMSDAKMSPFGEKPLIAYLCAVEAEINSIRIVMTGQFEGIPKEITRRRLREGI